MYWIPSKERSALNAIQVQAVVSADAPLNTYLHINSHKIIDTEEGFSILISLTGCIRPHTGKYDCSSDEDEIRFCDGDANEFQRTSRIFPGIIVNYF
jgi:hypothetical protein